MRKSYGLRDLIIFSSWCIPDGQMPDDDITYSSLK